jgi:hypothetical protein
LIICGIDQHMQKSTDWLIKNPISAGANRQSHEGEGGKRLPGVAGASSLFRWRAL